MHSGEHINVVVMLQLTQQQLGPVSSVCRSTLRTRKKKSAVSSFASLHSQLAAADKVFVMMIVACLFYGMEQENCVRKIFLLLFNGFSTSFRCSLVVAALLVVMLIDEAVGGDEKQETIRSRIQVRNVIGIELASIQHIALCHCDLYTIHDERECEKGNRINFGAIEKVRNTSRKIFIEN